MTSAKPVVIVTGSSGLIGVWPHRAGSPRHTRRSGSTSRPASSRRRPSKEVVVDITSNERVTRALEGVRARHGERLASVIHVAAYRG